MGIKTKLATMTAIMATSLFWLSGTAFAQTGAELFFEAPSELPQPGETFEVALYITDGRYSVASYALQVLYDRTVLNITEIRGGKDPVYAADPVSRRDSYTKGRTDFTAVRSGSRETPDTYQIAIIRFTVVAETHTATPIRVQTSPNGGLVDGKRFTLLQTQLPPVLNLRSNN